MSLRNKFVFGMITGFFIIGVFFLVRSPSITGGIVGAKSDYFGLFFIIFALVAFVVARTLEDRVGSKVGSVIIALATPRLEKAYAQAQKNGDVRREIEGIVSKLTAGNMQPGMGVVHLNDSKLNYVRGKNGGRVFYQKSDGVIRIVAICDKSEENNLIPYLRATYHS